MKIYSLGKKQVSRLWASCVRISGLNLVKMYGLFQVRPSKSRLFCSRSIDSERKQKNTQNTNNV